MKSKNTLSKFNASVNNAYFSYLFVSFWKRPVGYILSILYLLFLTVILIIVPKAMNNAPLFIWNLSSFNIPLFSLMFIGASCAASAVTLFRISKEDGTELSLSAKPLTKSAMVGIKTAVYLIVTLSVCFLSIAIGLLILPIFGKYTDANANGIEMSQYKALLLSLLLGNGINLIFFSGISVFITMVGGQVITMITSIGIAFVMVCGNFVFSKIAKTPGDVLSDQYGKAFNTLRLHTNKQLQEGKKCEADSFVSIECYVTDEGVERQHFDTYEYWNIASAKAMSKVFAYLNLGNQMSFFYSSFGLEDSKLADVKKLEIGYDPAYKYVLDKNSHITETSVQTNKEYPVFHYYLQYYQGKYYPVTNYLGNASGSVADKAYLKSLIYGLNNDSVIYLSQDKWTYSYPGKNIATKLNNKVSYPLNDLLLNSAQQAEVETIFTTYLSKGYSDGEFFNNNLTTSSSGIWQGEYNNLDLKEKYSVTSKILVYMFPLAQQKQFDAMTAFLDNKYPTEPSHVFPFTTKQFMDVYDNDLSFQALTLLLTCLTSYGFNVGSFPEAPGTNYYARLVTCLTPYLESTNNLYKFTISSLYSLPVLGAIWGSLAFALFASAIVVYKKTDFK